MYDYTVKSQAFLYFCQGVSFRRIAEMLRREPECESLTHGTIQKWAETPDETGKTWEDRKREYLVVVEKMEKDAVITQHYDVIKETDNIINDIIETLKTGNLQFKTKDAAVYAFKALAEYQERIKDKEKRVAIEDQVGLFFEAMNEIPEVSDALSKHWAAINVKFQEKAIKLLKKKNGR